MKFLFAATRFRLLLLLAALGLFASACSKDEAPAEYVSDDVLIQRYLTSQGITTAQKQPSGLYYVPGTLNPTGAPAVAGKTASVLYTGTLLTGQVFDASSLHGNTPFSFLVGAKQVIAGWDEGIALMRKGEKATLIIPSALAYGTRGAGSSVPPNAVLRFEVEVTDVK